MTSVKLDGGEQLHRLVREMKDAGDNEMRKKMLRGLREAGKPAGRQVQAAGLRKLPSRGGLAKLISGSKVAVRTRASSKTASVKLEQKLAGHDLKSIDKGRLRHPTYGHMPWVLQPIQSGYFSDEVEDLAPEVQRRLMEVLDDIAADIARSV